MCVYTLKISLVKEIPIIKVGSDGYLSECLISEVFSRVPNV